MIILLYLLYERCINKKGSENDSEPFLSDVVSGQSFPNFAFVPETADADPFAEIRLVDDGAVFFEERNKTFPAFRGGKMVVQFFISEVFAGCFPGPGENRLGVGVEMSVFQHIAVQFISLFIQVINQAKDDFWACSLVSLAFRQVTICFCRKSKQASLIKPGWSHIAEYFRYASGRIL